MTLPSRTRSRLRALALLHALALLSALAGACKSDEDKSAGPGDDESDTKKSVRDDDTPGGDGDGDDGDDGSDEQGDAPVPIDGAEVAAAIFGDGPEELGMLEPDEADPIGPSSFAVSEDGLVHVLDAYNGRIQLWKDGVHEGEIPVPSPGADDIALLSDGRLVVLDRFVEKKVFVIDREGDIDSEVEIVGVGLPEPGGVSAVLVRADGVWLRGDRRLVRVLDERMEPDASRPILPGDLSRDGKLLISTAREGSSLSVIVRERKGLPTNRVVTLELDEHIAAILGRDSDAAGRIYLATLHITGKGDERKVSAYLTVLSPELEQERRTEIAVPKTAHEVFRHLDVTASGKVHYLELSTTGAVVRRYQ